MLDKEQIVQAMWNPAVKNHYIELGYVFTRFKDTFEVKASELPHSSQVKVTGICDFCGKEKETTICNYYQVTKNETVPFTCGEIECIEKKKDNLSRLPQRQEQMNIFYKLCEQREYIPISTVDDYQNAKSNLKYICPYHGEQSTTLSNFKRGKGCKYCGYKRSSKKNSKTNEEVINIVESKNNNKLLNPDDYINANTKNLKIICGSCGNEFTTSLSSCMNSKGSCTKCGASKSGILSRLTSEQVEKTINSINNNTLLNPKDYVKNTVKNLKIKCGSCGNIFITNFSNYVYNGLNKCEKCLSRKSKGEELIKNHLIKREIKFEHEKKFKDCKDKRPLPFDFYLEDYNICIEYQGKQHYEPVEHFGGEKDFKNRQLHDSMKKEYCKEKGIKLIIIPYWEEKNIEKILDNELGINKKMKPKSKIA